MFVQQISCISVSGLVLSLEKRVISRKSVKKVSFFFLFSFVFSKVHKLCLAGITEKGLIGFKNLVWRLISYC